MKRLLLAAALTAMALSGTSVAHDHKPGNGHGHGPDKASKDYRKDRHHADKAYRKAVKEEEKAYRRWARGQYIPAEYRVSRYYIDDYRAYDLSPPPRGYAYVRPYQDDDTYYLVQIATGLISQIFGG